MDQKGDCSTVRGSSVELGTAVIYVFAPLIPFSLIALALASSFSGSRHCPGREELVSLGVH